jgi:hypothetical protein
LDINGVHKEYGQDQRKAHVGTLQYASRDAHVGAFSRRGDLESLGYNMLHWLCGKLPCEDNIDDPEHIHSQKESFMSNIPLLMSRCFPNSEPPNALSEYLKYVASLDFKTDPGYAHCRCLLRKGVEGSGYVDNGDLVFGGNSLESISENDRGNKRRATEDPENVAELKPTKKVCNNPRQPSASNSVTGNSPTSPVLPSHQLFTVKGLISANLENQVTEHAALNRKQPATIPAVLTQLPSNEVTQKSTASLPEVSEPSEPWQQSADTSFSNPTSAVSEIKSKLSRNASTPAAYPGELCRATTPVQPRREVRVTVAADRRSRKHSKGRPRRSRRAAFRRKQLDKGSAS